VVVVETKKAARAPGNESWWDVPVAEVSSMPTVQEARVSYEIAVTKERNFLAPQQPDVELAGSTLHSRKDK